MTADELDIDVVSTDVEFPTVVVSAEVEFELKVVVSLSGITVTKIAVLVPSDDETLLETLEVDTVVLSVAVELPATVELAETVVVVAPATVVVGAAVVVVVVVVDDSSFFSSSPLKAWLNA